MVQRYCINFLKYYITLSQKIRKQNSRYVNCNLPKKTGGGYKNE